MTITTFTLIIGTISACLGVVLGYFIRQIIASKQIGSVEARINQLTQDAKREAQELLFKAKDRAVAILEEAKKEENIFKRKLLDAQSRLSRREEILDQKLSEYDVRSQELTQKIEKVRGIKEELEALKLKEVTELERIAGLSKDDAKAELVSNIEKLYAGEILEHVKRLEGDKRVELEKKALDILASSIQRYARSHTQDMTTSVVSIPNDELKGRIIGREGRNIKTLERLTGVEVIIDETPNAITLSAFDPIRREIAKIALEKLVKDGRIQPARIEEKVLEAEREVKLKIQEAGEQAVYETGILNLPSQVVHLLGRLHFRYSFGQNILLHSIEACHLAGMLARELGANVEVSKRGALLHDIGKAVDHQLEGTHVELGRKILEKYGVEPEVIRAMESHHDEYPFASPEAFIVSAAESASAARPGARKETLEYYLKRVEDLERIATSFQGVEKAYAIQAGREIRIFVIPDAIDDLGALNLAREVANQIQQELKYPGEIKVNVIREKRAVEFAR